eukprot:CAMPEP_0183705316 /NCGR_PEP_ID=MMETSP0737-20130205/2456_1 /TAXON_ID=385413 /ORGANISM="Thalassiosira miniscula, Strain CCMP1093" /LENGTH=472 /DNA_ID=CAMNT_0025932453 /DNA_START=244 /DNA_END=1662 /DNA_ORIENTATION=-
MTAMTMKLLSAAMIAFETKAAPFHSQRQRRRREEQDPPAVSGQAPDDTSIGIANPASTNCNASGGTSEIRYGADGGEYGVCVFDDGDTACEEWALFRGECEKGSSNPIFSEYCSVNGGQLTSNWLDSESNPQADYQKCHLNNGVICVEYDYYGGGCTKDPDATTIGMPNPASVACEASGGSSEIKYEPDGGQYGVCMFEDGTACGEWALQRAVCEKGSEPNFTAYCSLRGGLMTMQPVDWGDIDGAPAVDYEICNLENGDVCVEHDYYGGKCAKIEDFDPAAAAAMIGMPNPVSVNCDELGGSSETKYAREGGEYNVCLFDDDTACSDWDLRFDECEEGDRLAFSVSCLRNGRGQLTTNAVDWGDNIPGAPDATYEVCTFEFGEVCEDYAYYSGGCVYPAGPAPNAAPYPVPSDEIGSNEIIPDIDIEDEKIKDEEDPDMLQDLSAAKKGWCMEVAFLVLSMQIFGLGFIIA